jgi:hypothetical protein
VALQSGREDVMRHFINDHRVNPAAENNYMLRYGTVHGPLPLSRQIFVEKKYLLAFLALCWQQPTSLHF